MGIRQAAKAATTLALLHAKHVVAEELLCRSL